MMNIAQKYYEGFVSLFFPQLCLACGVELPPNNEKICMACESELPKTNFHLHDNNDNVFYKRMWGRFTLRTAASLYWYNRGERTKNLIHNLKYKHQSEIAITLGQYYADYLLDAPEFQSVDVIVPVPMHPKKEKERGYNQADKFAEGLSDTFQKPWYKDALRKVTTTISQTKKGKWERIENVQNVFKINRPELLKGKHILLVDDVMTTGATLEACAIEILKVPNTQISLATIAITDYQ